MRLSSAVLALALSQAGCTWLPTYTTSIEQSGAEPWFWYFTADNRYVPGAMTPLPRVRSDPSLPVDALGICGMHAVYKPLNKVIYPDLSRKIWLDLDDASYTPFLRVSMFRAIRDATPSARYVAISFVDASESVLDVHGTSAALLTSKQWTLDTLYEQLRPCLDAVSESESRHVFKIVEARVQVRFYSSIMFPVHVPDHLMASLSPEGNPVAFKRGSKCNEVLSERLRVLRSGRLILTAVGMFQTD